MNNTLAMAPQMILTHGQAINQYPSIVNAESLQHDKRMVALNRVLILALSKFGSSAFKAS